MYGLYNLGIVYLIKNTLFDWQIFATEKIPSNAFGATVLEFEFTCKTLTADRWVPWDLRCPEDTSDGGIETSWL